MIARYPVLPLRDIVVFRHMIVPLLSAGRNLFALLKKQSNDKKIILVAQKQAGDENPDIDELYTMATMGTVLQLLKLPMVPSRVAEGGSRALSKMIDQIIWRLRSLSGRHPKTTLKPMRLAVRRSSS